MRMENLTLYGPKLVVGLLGREVQGLEYKQQNVIARSLYATTMGMVVQGKNNPIKLIKRKIISICDI